MADFHFEQSVEKNDVDSSPIAEHYIFPLFYPTVERRGKLWLLILCLWQTTKRIPRRLPSFEVPHFLQKMVCFTLFFNSILGWNF